MLTIGRSYFMGGGDRIQDLMLNTSTTWQSIVNNNAPLLNMLWTDQGFPWKDQADISPTLTLDPGLGVYDISYVDLVRTKTYSGLEICLVSPLNANCI